MINTVDFAYVISLIDNAISIEDINSLIIILKDMYGVSNIVYHALSMPKSNIPNPILVLTYEPEWVKRYIERDYFEIDPVVTFGRRGFLPIDWSTVDRDTTSARHFFKEADKFDVGRQGVTIPVRGPTGERALFTITANSSQREWQEKRVDYMREFQLIAHYIHDKVARLKGQRELGSVPNLSRRERQCLQGISNGLAAKQIAANLNISNTAIHLYLQSARHKLSCTTLPQAAIRAASLGLI